MANKSLPQDRPVYRLAGAYYDAHDAYHDAGKTIIFDGIPNQDMIPLNEKARVAYDKYMDELDEGHRVYCAKQEPPIAFVPHARIYDEEVEEILDVSPSAKPNPKDPNQFRMGARRKAGTIGAEVLEM